jgi:hypothetical protein
MAPKDGKSMMILTVAEGKTLEEAAQNAVKHFNFKVLENRKTTINGFPALAMVSQIQPQQQQGAQTTNQTPAQDPKTVVQVGTWLLQYNGMILAFHGMSYTPTFNDSYGTFRGVAEGFRNLTDPDKLNRKPERIRIKTVTRTASFKDTMKNLGMPDSRIDELGILNQMKPTDPVTQGTLMKVISK